MFIASAIVSVLLAALMTYAGVRKLGHSEPVVQSYLRVGVPEEKLDYLAITLFVGAGGLILGLAWAPLGIAAAIGTLCYFLVAISAHVRFRDLTNVPTPVTLAVLAGAALALRVATL